MTGNEPSLVRRVVRRVARYSTLRAAERALLPSVRQLVELPSARVARDVISNLHEMLDAARKASQVATDSRELPLTGDDPNASIESSEIAAIECQLEVADAGIDHLARELRGLIARTSVGQLRGTLPATTREHRSEALALLDLALENLTPAAEAPFLVDYSITLLASSLAPGMRTLRADPCSVTPGVEALCAAADQAPHNRSSEFADRFRAASLELLELDDLAPLIQQVRGLKRELAGCFFDREVLRSLVNYNIAVFNQCQSLVVDAREHDLDVERALASLRSLDWPGKEADSSLTG